MLVGCRDAGGDGDAEAQTVTLSQTVTKPAYLLNRMRFKLTFSHFMILRLHPAISTDLYNNL